MHCPTLGSLSARIDRGANQRVSELNPPVLELHQVGLLTFSQYCDVDGQGSAGLSHYAQLPVIY
jgi:hypothetical protein